MNIKHSLKFYSISMITDKSHHEIEPFNIEDCLITINDKGYYQIRTLIILSTLWGFVPIIAVLLPFFTLHPAYLCKVRNEDISDFKSCNYETICDPYFEFKVNKKDDTYQTWINDFELTCGSEYLIVLIGSLYFSGMIFSNLIIPSVCTKYGRLPVLKFIIMLYIVNNLLVILFQEINLLLIYSLIAGFIYTGISIPAFVLNFEYTTKKSKTLFSSIINSSYSIGAMIQIGVFYYIKNWRISLMINIVIFIFILINTNKIKESPSYLMINGKSKELLDKFEEIATLNERKDQLSLYMAYHHITNEVDNPNHKNINMDKKSNNILGFLSSDEDRRLFLAVGLSWFVNSQIQYGTVFNIKKYGSNIFINGISIYTASIVSIMLSSFVIDLYGLKTSLLIYYTINFIANGMITLVHIFEYNIIIGNIPCYFLLFLSSFSTSAIGSLNYIYTAELFKNKNMITAISLGSLINRFAGILSPLISQVAHPTLIFTILSCLTITVLINN